MTNIMKKGSSCTGGAEEPSTHVAKKYMKVQSSSRVLLMNSLVSSILKMD